jgi:CBS domain containing-hemolysin-like protein
LAKSASLRLTISSLDMTRLHLPKINVPARAKVTRHEDGSYLIDASVPFPEVMQLTGMSDAPEGDYVTLAGFILAQLGELPKPGDHVIWGGWRFEVVDMDGRRIESIVCLRLSRMDSSLPGLR